MSRRKRAQIGDREMVEGELHALETELVNLEHTRALAETQANVLRQQIGAINVALDQVEDMAS